MCRDLFLAKIVVTSWQDENSTTDLNSVSFVVPQVGSTRGVGDVGGTKTRTHFQLHRFTTITANNLGFGLNKSKPFLKYLGLKEGENFESVERFKYRDDDNHIECGSDAIKHKKWGYIRLALFSDVDHLIGRAQLWMNSNYFIWLTSHTHNQQLMYVCQYFHNWGYGFYPFPYVNGNGDIEDLAEKKIAPHPTAFNRTTQSNTAVFASKSPTHKAVVNTAGTVRFTDASTTKMMIPGPTDYDDGDDLEEEV